MLDSRIVFCAVLLSMILIRDKITLSWWLMAGLKTNYD